VVRHTAAGWGRPQVSTDGEGTAGVFGVAAGEKRSRPQQPPRARMRWLARRPRAGGGLFEGPPQPTTQQARGQPRGPGATAVHARSPDLRRGPSEKTPSTAQAGSVCHQRTRCPQGPAHAAGQHNGSACRTGIDPGSSSPPQTTPTATPATSRDDSDDPDGCPRCTAMEPGRSDLRPATQALTRVELFSGWIRCWRTARGQRARGSRQHRHETVPWPSGPHG